jgi:hypothetical protein
MLLVIISKFFTYICLVSFLSSSAGVLCNVLGFVNLATFLPFFGTNAQAVFYTGMFFVLVTVIPTLLLANEVPYKAGYTNLDNPSSAQRT